SSVTARAGDDGKTDPGIAGGPFQDKAAALQFAALLSLKNHLLSGSVLHRLARIHELGLAEDGATGFFGSPRQLDERGIADRFDDVVVDGHVLKSPVLA